MSMCMYIHVLTLHTHMRTTTLSAIVGSLSPYTHTYVHVYVYTHISTHTRTFRLRCKTYAYIHTCIYTHMQTTKLRAIVGSLNPNADIVSSTMGKVGISVCVCVCVCVCACVCVCVCVSE